MSYFHFFLNLSSHNHSRIAKYLSSLKMSGMKIWEAIRSQYANSSLPVAVRVSKTRVLNNFPLETALSAFFPIFTVLNFSLPVICRQHKIERE